MASPPYPIAAETAGMPRILIVDDEPAILFAYRKLIEKEGLAVDICETLAHALSYIASNTYLGVIADLRLAGSDNTDGLEVVRTIRAAQPETSVILTTGYGNSSIELAALGLGVDHYFEKPVRPAVIIEVLRSLVNRSDRIVSQASCQGGNT